jgi:hypothetical protein
MAEFSAESHHADQLARAFDRIGRDLAELAEEYARAAGQVREGTVPLSITGYVSVTTTLQSKVFGALQNTALDLAIQQAAAADTALGNRRREAR